MILDDGLRIRKETRDDLADDSVYLFAPDVESRGGRVGRFRPNGLRRRPLLVASTRCRSLLKMLCLLFLVVLLIYFARSQLSSRPADCDSAEKGYQCHPEISHYWGQYSPFFAVPSDIDPAIPPSCKITFVQILSRHGARDPTKAKTASYRETIKKIQSDAGGLTGEYRFLADFQYDLGADQLTEFGRKEMYNSGLAFYNRYRALTSQVTPFIRASGQERVVNSAEQFSRGFHDAKMADRVPDPSYPYNIVTISETHGSNNTLDHGLCTAFEKLPTYTSIGPRALANFSSTFLPRLRLRLATALAPTNLTDTDILNLLDLCPFVTVSDAAAESPFCALFTKREWREYDYFQTLSKFYSYGPGNPLGPTQGVGFVNELIARLTGQPVKDATSVNHTLDAFNSSTFPLMDKGLYVDVSHDNDMVGVFGAMGLFDGVPELPTDRRVEPEEVGGFAAGWVVPFAARGYVEKMVCGGEGEEEMVRVVINNRVVPLTQCGGDALGRCTLERFVGSLGFAQKGGKWAECFDQGGGAEVGIVSSGSGSDGIAAEVESA